MTLLQRITVLNASLQQEVLDIEKELYITNRLHFIYQAMTLNDKKQVLQQVIHKLTVILDQENEDE